ncbi:protein adenylyltransferase SelO family protein [Sphingomonas nostoxanthinifaciens]|uniref:protein adenylyltransferase SelO family protein n=1 Tax=Sphingomonas nostoxanthinifaciens TaxID=2872652 RepID=UPI001CC1D550|nr:YdiU family protein [Sphingomonas nostoxanthinifaciens]UAK26195.1 YdiU family protein [Sphingomonas nostoxanthinifaciens]
MTISPQATSSRPERILLEVADFLADPVAAARFPQTILRFRNDRAAAEVGLDGLSDAEWLAHFGRFEPLPGSLPEPLALRYHGHQFRAYNPDIGDGRGFTFAQVRDEDGRLLDLGTKGSGTTPYSRFGDGRLTLKGGVREILATEMLEALGVRTSRSFSLVETGEALHRGDEPSPTRSAVLVRLSHGHIRIGSFQRLATLGQPAEMARLVAYVLEQLYGEQPGEAPALQLLEHVVAGTARLAASYMAAGFVHGVLNSDNINVTAESFDYGPWRFTPFWDTGFTAAYFDAQGLYAFGRQAQAIHWDVVQLAIALTKLADVEALGAILDAFPALYEQAHAAAMLARLGVTPRGEAEDLALVQAIEESLTPGSVTIDRFFFDWAGGRRRAPSPADDAYAADFAGLEALLAPYAPSRRLDHAYWSDAEPCSMHIAEVEAIWSAIDRDDDWAPLHAKVAAIRRMGEALA